MQEKTIMKKIDLKCITKEESRKYILDDIGKGICQSAFGACISGMGLVGIVNTTNKPVQAGVALSALVGGAIISGIRGTKTYGRLREYLSDPNTYIEKYHPGTTIL